MRSGSINVAGIDLEIAEEGTGAPVLMLHGAGGFDTRQPVNALISEHRRLICPSHPGFGKSALPDWLDSVDDIAHVYLELLDKLDLPTVDLDRLFASAAGLPPKWRPKCRSGSPNCCLSVRSASRPAAPDQLDLPDVFALSPVELNRLLFRDPHKMAPDPAIIERR